MHTMFLIWSFEHRAWWRPNSSGYTQSIDEAGAYMLEDALQLCTGANLFHPTDPHEAIVPIPARPR